MVLVLFVLLALNLPLTALVAPTALSTKNSSVANVSANRVLPITPVVSVLPATNFPMDSSSTDTAQFVLRT